MVGLRGKVAIGVLIALMCLPLAGCADASSDPPAGTDRPPAVDQEQPATDGETATDGEALVSEKCSQCHSIDRVDAAVKDGPGWESTVARMEKNGLEVTDQERATIVDWLTQRDANR